MSSALVEGPIVAGSSLPPADPRPVDLGAIGYTEEEFFVSGRATAYASFGELRADGNWEVTPSIAAPYKTRFLVRRPSDPARFNGTVVVEWLNVTVVEAAAEWAYTNRAIVDAGAAWIGASVQSFGIVGGTSAIQTGAAEQEAQAHGGIRAACPERYGALAHPGDHFAFDIFCQIGAAIRSPARAPVLGPRQARLVIAAGESQSAAFITTYVNAIQQHTNVFDGFFVHSRGAGAARPDGTLDINGSTTSCRLRADLGTPVMVFETETDVGPLLRFSSARQPDTGLLRTWEVAGTAHADAYLVNGAFPLCPDGINDGPHHYVATAALAALLRWVEDGTAPPHGEPILTGGEDGMTVVRDTYGNALGGIRTPPVDVPVGTLTGEAPQGAPALCALFGSATPFDRSTLASLYPSKQTYVDAFEEALDRAIGHGFVRSADREEFAAEARAAPF